MKRNIKLMVDFNLSEEFLVMDLSVYEYYFHIEAIKSKIKK